MSLVIANGDRQSLSEKIDENDNHARRESSFPTTEETRLGH